MTLRPFKNSRQGKISGTSYKVFFEQIIVDYHSEPVVFDHKGASMDVSYINPFISATITTFKTMMNIEVKPDKPSLKTSPFPTYDISGIIGLSGNAQGNIAISFPKIIALKIVSKMVGADIKVIGPELADGIGELANIIAGNAKKDLIEYQLSISLPNVIIGKAHTIANQSGVPAIIVPFVCPLGNFAMEVSLKTK
jgi:chemotaxis protein CheX